MNAGGWLIVAIGSVAAAAPALIVLLIDSPAVSLAAGVIFLSLAILYMLRQYRRRRSLRRAAEGKQFRLRLERAIGSTERQA